MRILIAQANQALAEELRLRLNDYGYNADLCTDGEEAAARILMDSYDAAVLDILLPNMNGVEVLQQLRAADCRTPVIFLTAKADEREKVNLLLMGASEYLVWPIPYEELSARILAVVRTAGSWKTEVCRVGDLAIDTRYHTVTKGGKDIPLTRKEYALLEYLALNQGHILSKERIESHIWGMEPNASNEVEVYISYLRRKLGEHRGNQMIYTIRGLGYMMKAPSVLREAS